MPFGASLAAYRDAGGRGSVALQVHVSYATDEAEALAVAHDQWRNGALGPPVCWDTDSVEAFDAMTELVRPEDLREAVLISDDPAAARRVAGGAGRARVRCRAHPPRR